MAVSGPRDEVPRVSTGRTAFLFEVHDAKSKPKMIATRAYLQFAPGFMLNTRCSRVLDVTLIQLASCDILETIEVKVYSKITKFFEITFQSKWFFNHFLNPCFFLNLICSWKQRSWWLHQKSPPSIPHSHRYVLQFAAANYLLHNVICMSKHSFLLNWLTAFCENNNLRNCSMVEI